MYDINARHVINQVNPILENLIKAGKRDFGIYPYGNIGRFIDKEILRKQYGILPRVLIDNTLYDGKAILSLEQAKEQQEGDITYLVCSENQKFYNEIRSALFSVFSKEQIVDLFPCFTGEPWLDKKKISDTFSVIDGWVEKLESGI